MNIADLFPQSGPSDWKLYLEKTLVLTQFPKSEGYEICHVDSISEEPGMCKISLLRYSNKSVVKVTPKDWDVLLFQPESGYYSIRRTAILMSRLALRQNKKGVCLHTIGSHNLFDPIYIRLCKLRDLEGIDKRFPKAMIDSVIFDQNCDRYHEIYTAPVRFFDLSDACKRISQGKVFARALAKHFAISASINTQYPYTLWYNDLPVGGITDDCRIVVDEHLFFQETFDVFNQKYEVIAR